MIARRAQVNVSCMALAWVTAVLGDLDGAYRWVERAIEERDTLVAFVHIYTPMLAPDLASDPRYDALLARLGASCRRTVTARAASCERTGCAPAKRAGALTAAGGRREVLRSRVRQRDGPSLDRREAGVGEARSRGERQHRDWVQETAARREGCHGLALQSVCGVTPSARRRTPPFAFRLLPRLRQDPGIAEPDLEAVACPNTIAELVCPLLDLGVEHHQAGGVEEILGAS